MKISRRHITASCQSPKHKINAAINKLPAGVKPADTSVKDYAEQLADAVCKSLTDNGYICDYSVSTKSVIFTVAVDTSETISINFILPLSAIVPEATVSADMSTVVDKIMNLAPLTAPGTEVDLTAEITSATKIQASVELDDDSLDLLYEIADRYSVSKPVSGSWDTETAHEQAAIANELGVSMDEAKGLMIAYLGFSTSDFSSQPYLSASTKVCADAYRQYRDPELLQRQIDDITAEYEARKAAGDLSEDEAWSYEQEIQEYKDELRFAYEDQEADTVFGASTISAASSYLSEFGDAVVGELWNSYGIKGNYEITGSSIAVYFYSTFRTQKPWTHVTRTYDEIVEMWGDDPTIAAEKFTDEVLTRLDDISDEAGIEGATSVETIDDKEPVLGGYQDDEAYKKLAEYGYILDTTDDGCVIKFSDGDPYATFRFRPPTADEIADGLDEWLVYADGELINNRVDFPPYNYDDAVTESIRYFWSHY